MLQIFHLCIPFCAAVLPSENQTNPYNFYVKRKYHLTRKFFESLLPPMTTHLPWRHLLRDNGYSLADLAERAQVTPATASRWLQWCTYRDRGFAPPLTKCSLLMEMCRSDKFSQGQLWAHLLTGDTNGHN